jgi:hypothetical protein
MLTNDLLMLASIVIKYLITTCLSGTRKKKEHNKRECVGRSQSEWISESQNLILEEKESVNGPGGTEQLPDIHVKNFVMPSQLQKWTYPSIHQKKVPRGCGSH